MKVVSLVVFVLLLNMCDRPPAGKEINRNATDHSKMDHNRMGHSMTSSPNAASAPFDLQFIDSMIAHHQGAIEMSQLVPTRAQHEELKTLAKNIVAEQQKEISQMRELRAEWFREAEPAINMDFPGMHEGMSGMDLTKLDKLKANEFDVEFVRQMIAHHEGAVSMAQAISGVDAHAELKTLADNIIKSQSAEIEQMKKWLGEWSK